MTTPTWQLLQPTFGASLEDELFAELDEDKKTPRTNDSSDSEEDEEGVEDEEETVQQPWTHICVLDFEACREKVSSSGEQEEWLYEITEVPVTLLNCTSLQVEDTFHRYCRPAHISPEVVQRYIDGKYGALGQADAWHQNAVGLHTALLDLEHWLQEKGLLPAAKGESPRMAFLTCGDWDFKNALPRNCNLLGIPVPHFMLEWINIKEVYHKFYKTRRAPSGMTTMLRELDIPLEGAHHFGKDDANNITKIVRRMIQDGCQLFITGREADMWHKREED